MDWKQRKIGVLMGGLSAERDISMATGEAVHRILVEQGYDAHKIFVDRDLDQMIRQLDVEVVFNALDGRYGEDGCVQGMLELFGIPYTGSGPLASGLAMDKVRAKELFRLYNLPTPPGYDLDRRAMADLDMVHGTFGYPCVVKPVQGGSSVGVAMVQDAEALESACETALRFDDRVQVERYIDGIEMTVAILDGETIGALEVVPPNGIYDFRAKYTPNVCEVHHPPRLSPARYKGVLTQAVRAYQALGCSGLASVDMVLSDSGNEFILEVNTQPALSRTSPMVTLARAEGMELADLVEAMLDLIGLHSSDRVSGDRRMRQMRFDGTERRAASMAKPH